MHLVDKMVVTNPTVLCAVMGATLLVLLLLIGVSLAIAAANKSKGVSTCRGGDGAFTLAEAQDVAKTLDIDWNGVPYTANDLRRGMNVELEHGCADAQTNVTGDDPVQTAKIALAHLNESPRYYDFLEDMERKFQ